MNVARRPTNLEELKEALDRFPKNEIFPDVEELAPRVTTTSIDYCGATTKRVAGLSYSTSTGRIAFDYIGDDLLISAVSGNGVDGATLRVDASGTPGEFYAHKRDRASVGGAFDDAIKNLSNEKKASLKERFEAELKSIDFDVYRALFFTEGGSFVDVVRRYSWTDDGRVERESFEKPTRIEAKTSETQNPSLSTTYPDLSTRVR